jgi:tryptophan synthase
VFFILKDLTLHSLDRPAFVAFTTAGFPSPAETVDILLGLEKGGADVIELGKSYE